MKTTNTSASLLLATVVLVATACGDTAEPATTQTPVTAVAAPTTAVPLEVAAAPPENYAQFREQPTACGAEAPPALVEQTFSEPEDLGLDPDTSIRARIETSCGDLVVELDPSIAPATVNSFVFLAQQGYFDGGAAHRVLPGFVLQAGDPTATGAGNPGYALADELPAPGIGYERGVLAMANAGPNTSGSQFFVMLADSGLPPAYSVFGRVVEGDDVLDVIASLPLGDRVSGFTVERSVPLETLYLERVIIEE
jgi:cyclophilin family peptidyl-prolyl cis-trans isomerase